jgi:hypothetical protein
MWTTSRWPGEFNFVETWLMAYSPKSVYRLADMWGIEDLKELAVHQIMKNLTVENALTEACSAFSAVFDEVSFAFRWYPCAHCSKHRSAHVNLTLFAKIG